MNFGAPKQLEKGCSSGRRLGTGSAAAPDVNKGGDGGKAARRSSSSHRRPRRRGLQRLAVIRQQTLLSNKVSVSPPASLALGTFTASDQSKTRVLFFPPSLYLAVGSFCPQA